VTLVNKHPPQPTSELLNPTYPGAHLSLSRRHALAPRWTSPHLTLYAFPKAFLTRPEAPYPVPNQSRPYPAQPPRRLGEEQRSADMSMQMLAVNSRLVRRPAVRVKIKRRLKEAVRLIVTRGAAVERSRKDPKVVFCAEDVGADKWIAPGALLLLFHRTQRFYVVFRCLLLTDGAFNRRLDVCCFAHIRNVPHVVCGIA
jgi:hypothetical protein